MTGDRPRLAPAELVSGPDRPSRGAASGARILRVLTGHELGLLARRGESLLVTFGIPVAVLLFFGGLGLPGAASEVRPVDLVLPGALAIAVMATGLVSLGISTAYERMYGVLKRLGGSPASGAQLAIAKILAVVIVEVLQAVVLVGVAVGVLGWLPGPTADPARVVVTLLVGSIAFAGLGLLVAAVLRAETTIAVTNGLFLASLALAGVVVPLSRLPTEVATIARYLPATALTDALRSGLGLATPDAMPLAILSVWAVVGAVAAALRFRWT